MSLWADDGIKPLANLIGFADGAVSQPVGSKTHGLVVGLPLEIVCSDIGFDRLKPGPLRRFLRSGEKLLANAAAR